jgi:hypothetical protein
VGWGITLHEQHVSSNIQLESIQQNFDKMCSKNVGKQRHCVYNEKVGDYEICLKNTNPTIDQDMFFISAFMEKPSQCSARQMFCSL